MLLGLDELDSKYLLSGREELTGFGESDWEGRDGWQVPAGADRLFAPVVMRGGKSSRPHPYLRHARPARTQ